MMIRLIGIGFLAFLLTAPFQGEGVLNGAVHAQERQEKKNPSSSRYRQNSRQQDVMTALKDAKLKPYPQIKRGVEKQLKGRVVSQQLLRSNKHGWVYQLRVSLEGGRVRYVEVDAKTGRILKVK